MASHALFLTTALLLGSAAASSGLSETCAAGASNADREECEVSSLLQTHSPRRLDGSDGQPSLKAVQLTINSPRDMVKALQRITGSNSFQKQLYCDSANRSVKVADNLFGSVGLDGPNLDGRGVDFEDPKPPNTAVAMIFWSPASVFPTLIKACCDVEGGGECACAMNEIVGIPAAGKTFENQRFLVVEGVVTNESATPIENTGPVARNKPISTLSPTWANLAKTTPSVFDDVFTKSGIDWKQKCQSGKISESVVTTLEGFTLGCGNFCNENNTGTAGTIVAFIEEFPSMTSLYNISCKVADDCSTCTDMAVDGQPSAQAFFDAVPGPDGLCSDAATVRAFMFYYYDANSLFCGTGEDPGGLEFVTVPNLLISEAGGKSAQIDLFEGSFTCHNN